MSEPDTADLARRDAIARVIYDDLEGPVADQDAARQMRQWEQCQRIADTILAQAVLEKDAEIERLKGVVNSVEGNIVAMRDAITHPHGQRAHFIDSQDQIRVEALDAALEEIFQARTALKDNPNG